VQQLDVVIKQKEVDLVVIGTHGRGSVGKLLLGSTAEQIFRHADCFVDTVGPGSYKDSLVEKTEAVRPRGLNDLVMGEFVAILDHSCHRLAHIV